VRCSRSFISRIYCTAAKVQELEYFTHLNTDFGLNFSWWHTFLAEQNGISLLCYTSPLFHHDFCIQTDASGSFSHASWFRYSNWCIWLLMICSFLWRWVASATLEWIMGITGHHGKRASPHLKCGSVGHTACKKTSTNPVWQYQCT